MPMSLYPSETVDRSLKVTLASCRAKKERGEKITCLTAYDYPFARLFDEAGVDILLVGDSWGMAAAGLDSTLAVTVADMPFGSYHLGAAQAVENAIRLVKEAGAETVKLEGGESRAAVIAAIVNAEVPVMAHIGLTPQSVHRQSGYHVQGVTQAAAEQLLRDADAVQAAGAFSVVLEGVPRELAAAITRQLAIPTIGIGAGPECDGQVLVMHDLLGLSFRPRPKFVRPYAELAQQVRGAAETFRLEVESGAFPADAESYHLPKAAKVELPAPARVRVRTAR